jgi:hydrogenase/urease accessory protein HupE
VTRLTGRLLVLLCLAWSSSALAHEIRPAYLQIDETSPNHYDLLWKVPSRGDRVLTIEPRFDDSLAVSKAEGHALLDGFVLFRYEVSGEGGLPGTTLSIPGLAQTTVDVLVNVNLLNGVKHTLLLQPRAYSATIPESRSAWQVAATYTRLGIEHILLGIDHLLFIGSLMLIVAGWRMLIKTITAFTVAHSITLSLVVLGFVTLPPQPVEVMIALSIVLVCVEVVRRNHGGSSLAIQWPWLVAFAFGLLHGFGFAGALLQLGLPQEDAPAALLFFNIGVEAGQIIFIAAILTLLAVARRMMPVSRKAPVAVSYAIGSVASFWVFDRLYTTFFI